MATKKNAMGNLILDPKKMTAAHIKSSQKLLAEIGSGKRNGFIYMASTDGERVKGSPNKLKAEGLVFVHGTSPMNIIMNLVENLPQVDPRMVALEMMMVGIKGKKSK